MIARKQRRASYQPVPTPVYRATLTYQKAPKDMTPEEALAWLRDMRGRLQVKMQRERAYLDRRAARGTHTPTDDAYEADQVLETEILSMLDVMEQSLLQEVNP